MENNFLEMFGEEKSMGLPTPKFNCGSIMRNWLNYSKTIYYTRYGATIERGRRHAPWHYTFRYIMRLYFVNYKNINLSENLSYSWDWPKIAKNIENSLNQYSQCIKSGIVWSIHFQWHYNTWVNIAKWPIFIFTLDSNYQFVSRKPCRFRRFFTTLMCRLFFLKFQPISTNKIINGLVFI